MFKKFNQVCEDIEAATLQAKAEDAAQNVFDIFKKFIRNHNYYYVTEPFEKFIEFANQYLAFDNSTSPSKEQALNITELANEVYSMLSYETYGKRRLW